MPRTTVTDGRRWCGLRRPAAAASCAADQFVRRSRRLQRRRLPNNSLEVAEFSARTGKPLAVLVACGKAREAAIAGTKVTKLASPWELPTYPVPGPPLIAW